MARLPAAAVLLALAGLLPLLACAAGALLLPAEKAAAYRVALIDFSAIALAAHGAVHWGIALAAPQPRHTTLRLVFGMLPALAGWTALLLRGLYGPAPALALLLAAFAATLLMEFRLQRRGLLPRGYFLLRVVLGIAVIVTLTIVLTTLVMGRTIRN